MSKLRNKENGDILNPANDFVKNDLLKTGLYEVIEEKVKSKSKENKVENKEEK